MRGAFGLWSEDDHTTGDTASRVSPFSRILPYAADALYQRYHSQSRTKVKQQLSYVLPYNPLNEHMDLLNTLTFSIRLYFHCYLYYIKKVYYYYLGIHSNTLQTVL